MGVMGSPGEQGRPRLSARAGRVAGAGLGGAVLGAAIAGIWHAAAAGAKDACRPPLPGSGARVVPCLPVPQVALAVLGGFAVICLGVLALCALLRLRPLAVSIPVGCVVVGWTTVVTGAGFPGGQGPAPWAAAVAAGAGLAAVALTVDWGWAQVAGVAAIVVIVVASLALPRLAARPEQANARVRQFAALGFPLELPSMPGYQVAAAHPSADRSLIIDLEPDEGSGTSAYAITVTIGPAGNKDVAGDLAECAIAPPRPACRPLSPRQWLLILDSGPVALTETGDIVAEAAWRDGLPQGGLPQAAGDTLLKVLSTLSPATPAEVASLR